MQIQVTIGTNLNRNKIVVPDTETIRNTLEANDIDYSVATVNLDGASLKAGDMDKTFAELGITEKCYLCAVVKAENA
jgi:glutaminase